MLRISVVNEDSSTTSNYDDSSFEVQSDEHGNDSSNFEHHSTDEILPKLKRQFHKTDFGLYPINSFVIRVEIEMILNIDHMNIVSFYSSKKYRSKRRIIFKGTIPEKV